MNPVIVNEQIFLVSDVLGAQEMRTYKQAEEAGSIAGFDMLESIDLATASPVAGPW